MHCLWVTQPYSSAIYRMKMKQRGLLIILNMIWLAQTVCLVACMLDLTLECFLSIHLFFFFFYITQVSSFVDYILR